MQSKTLAALAAVALLSSVGARAQVEPPPPPDTTAVWQLHIDVTTSVQDAATNSGLTLGTNPDATDGFDATFDTQGPSNPPINFAGINLRHTNNEPGFENRGGTYIQDIRAPLGFGEGETFNNITVESDLGAQDAPATITLTWNLESVDPRIRLNFNDPDDVNGDGIQSYDMASLNSFSFAQYITPDNPFNRSMFNISAINSSIGAAPVIRNVQLSNVTATGATISYNTDVAAGGILEYGTSADNLNNSITQSAAATGQTFNVTGLTPNTQYFFRIRTSQPGLAEASTTVQNVTTLRQLTPVGNITFNPSATSATVNFETSDPVSAVVAFGTSADNLNQSVTVPDLRTAQSVLLPTLQPGTQYFVRVTRSAAGFDPLISEVLSFSTLGTLTLSDPVVSNISASGATVTVNTGMPTNVTLRYGTTELNQTQSTPTPGTANVFTLTGLLPATTYQVQATATSEGFADRTSAVVTFTTLRTLNVTQPPTASNIGPSTATISLATDVPVTAVLEYGINDTFSLTSSITTATTTPTFSLTSLSPSSTYQYRVRLQAAGFETVTTAPLTFTTGAAVTLGNGDVNGDGSVTVADAILAARFVVGVAQLTPQQIANADVRLNVGEIDVADVVWILKMAVGLIPPPPPG